MKLSDWPIMNFQFWRKAIPLGLFLLISIVWPFSDVSHSKKGTHKQGLKPMIIIEDANFPGLSYDGHRIIVAPEVGVTEVYDVGTQQKIKTFNVPNSTNHAITADGKRVVIFSQEITSYSGNHHNAKEIYSIFDVDSGNLAHRDESKVIKNGVWFSNLSVYNQARLNSKNIAADLNMIVNIPPSPSSYENPEPSHPAVILGRLEDHRLIREFITDGFASGDFWKYELMTPDGKLTGATRYNVKQPKRNQTIIWDTQTGKVILNLPFYSRWLSLSDNGQRLATNRESNSDLITEVWDVSTGKRISTVNQTFKNKKVKVTGGVLSPSGKILATTGDSSIMLWNTDNGKLAATQRQDDYGTQGNIIESICFSGDGNILAVGNTSEVVTIWSVKELLNKTRGK